MATGTMVTIKIEDTCGLIINESSRGLWNKGDKIHTKKLEDFSVSKVVNISVVFTEESDEVIVYAVKIKRLTDDVEVPTPTGTVFIANDMKDVISIDPEDTPSLKTISEKEKSITNGYYINPESRLVYSTALGISNKRPERAVKIMMVGPSGYGKTTLPRLLAEKAGLNFLRMNCAMIRDPEEWFGYREARDGNTVFVRSQFSRAIEEGNVVIVLDEFNRLEPWLHNTLFPLLDDDGCTVVHDEEFRIGPGVIVVGTINTGYKYTGTFELDEALMNRFEFILEVGPMPHENEVTVLMTRNSGLKIEDADAIVKMANTLRQQDVICSTRTSLLIANMVLGGMTIRQAFESAVVRRIPQDSSGTSLRKQVIESINNKLGVFKLDKVVNDIFGESLEENAVVTVPHKAACRICLSRNPSVELLHIQACKYISSLTTLGPDGMEVFYSLSESKSILNQIAFTHEAVYLDLASEPSKSLIDLFSVAGIHASVVGKG